MHSHGTRNSDDDDQPACHLASTPGTGFFSFFNQLLADRRELTSAIDVAPPTTELMPMEAKSVAPASTPADSFMDLMNEMNDTFDKIESDLSPDPLDQTDSFLLQFDELITIRAHIIKTLLTYILSRNTSSCLPDFRNAELTREKIVLANSLIATSRHTYVARVFLQQINIAKQLNKDKELQYGKKSYRLTRSGFLKSLEAVEKIITEDKTRRMMPSAGNG